ncbi:(2Fe-2S)-binding protein [bacterium]|nr:(2Fe-2S)-binding protein [bacterium]
MMAKVFVCRCEDVTEEEIRAAVRAGRRDLESLKRYLAAGTGPCQARHCMSAIARVLEDELGAPLDGTAPFVSRPPFAAATIGEFAATGAGDDGDSQ